MNSKHFKLSVMMFLEFFIWGAWLPLIFGYLPSLNFKAGPEVVSFASLSDAWNTVISFEQGWILNAFAIASLTALLFSTQFADRNFAAERFLAFSHLVGGCAMVALTWTTTFSPFFVLMLIHCLFYVPTISITNSIAFANLSDPQKEFGRIRLWGTIGWIAASVPFVFVLADWAKIPEFGSVDFVTWLGAALGTAKEGDSAKEATRYIFLASGIASLVLAAFSLILPHTPPKPAGQGGEKLAWVEAVKLLGIPFVLVLWIVTFFDAAVHQGYFLFTNDFLQRIGVPSNWVMPAMSIGQLAEIGTMAMLGYFLKRLGWRYTMIIGILGHALRFAVFSLMPPPWLAIGIIVVHGICYAFFFATVYIFVDEFFPKDARSSAQGLFNLQILGFGQLAANFGWPWLAAEYFTPEGTKQINFGKFFLVPSAVALGAAIFLFLFFRPPEKSRSAAA
jgi:MFS family permease